MADAAPKVETVSEKTPVGEAVAARDSDVKMEAAEGVSVLMYHMIGDIPDNGAVLTEENFRAQLEFIRKNGFHPISMTELYAYVTEGRRFRKSRCASRLTTGTRIIFPSCIRS